ncbi:MAG: acetylornithine transaminase [Nitrospirota bacterium]|nr:acetylornithine transaminase [Nitrospirota bacterium]
MTGDELINASKKYLMNTYNRFPVALTKGRGTQVFDIDGRKYLDFMAGIAVNNLGHCHPKVTVAIQKQAQRLLHVSNYFQIEQQTTLARLLVENSFADKVFFCNSGAEANEAAIKLARRWSKEKHGPHKHGIITALQSFHGRTLGAITATGQEKFHKGFEPLVPGFSYVPFGDASALEAAVTDDTCAILLEPIQGEGGVIVPPADYFRKVRRLCDEKKLVLIFDEVQTGMGRTGKLFAYEQFGITPDIMTLAKALGNGVPIGATLATDEVATGFVPGTHASTFGGNPLVCAAAIATIETILEDGLVLENCRRMGAYFTKQLHALKKKHPIIREIRGMGLLLGLLLDGEGAGIVGKCLDAGVIINCTSGNVLRFVPPLTVTEQEIDEVIGTLDEVLKGAA